MRYNLWMSNVNKNVMKTWHIILLSLAWLLTGFILGFFISERRKINKPIEPKIERFEQLQDSIKDNRKRLNFDTLSKGVEKRAIYSKSALKRDKTPVDSNSKRLWFESLGRNRMED